MIDPHEAWRLLEPHLAPTPSLETPRPQALGRVLARSLSATVDVPAADVSAMDGYALAPPEPGESESPIPLRPLVGESLAGSPPSFSVPPGAAARIMTGAIVPEGTDRVLPVERTRPHDGRPHDEEADPSSPLGATPGAWGEYAQERVELAVMPPAGANIRRQGEVLRRGAPLLEAGHGLSPGALALLAAHGYSQVPIHRPPSIRLLVTGDEVIPPEETPAGGQLRDTHSDFLLAAARTLGLEIEPLGIVGDDEAALDQAVARGLEADLFLLTGGVSAGQRDLVPAALQRHGVRTLFHKVAIQPAKPLFAGLREGPPRALVFGLPGNPASAIVAFWLYLRPVLRRLLGAEDSYLQGLRHGVLESPLPGAKGRDRFLPARVHTVDGQTLCTPVAPAGSHDIAAYAQGSALVRIPAHAAPRDAGEACEILSLADEREG
ncbi:MAG: molybdopterin molybdotransferase MoeA [Acidobacteriota bacterium]